MSETKPLFETYLHIGNGGVEFSVLDDGFGPKIKVRGTCFGQIFGNTEINTDRESLKALGEMFLKAAEYNEYSERYCHHARLVEETGSGETIGDGYDAFDGPEQTEFNC